LARKSGSGRYTNTELAGIRLFYSDGYSIRQITDLLRISHNVVDHVCRGTGRSYEHIRKAFPINKELRQGRRLVSESRTGTSKRVSRKVRLDDK
jgi:predicted DNA-binding protein YlxM (UPF0122 family)